jgi:hypothetical protein
MSLGIHFCAWILCILKKGKNHFTLLIGRIQKAPLFRKASITSYL